MNTDSKMLPALEALQELNESMLDSCTREDWQALTLLDNTRRELIETIPADWANRSTECGLAEQATVQKLIDTIIEQDGRLQLQIQEYRDTLACNSINQRALNSVRRNYLATESL